jgi:hypothetical protein
MDSLGPLERLHIQIRDILLPIATGKTHAHLKLGVEHHIILPQSALAVVDTQHSLLHLHLLSVTAPAGRVVLPLLAARRGGRAVEGDTRLGEGQAGTTMASSFADAP